MKLDGRDVAPRIHRGPLQSALRSPEPRKTFRDLLELARYPNVHVKLCGAPLLSEQAYPYDDVRPKLEQLFRAFSVDPVMWGSDYTRLRMADRTLFSEPPGD